MTPRRYGRNSPAPLPLHRMLSRANTGLPPAVDLSPLCGPIKDQGQEGSCTGHAFSSAIEWICRKYLNRSPILSPQYFYVRELVLQGDFPQDAGSDGVTGSSVAVAHGCCTAASFPYVSGQITMPTASQDAEASQYCMGAYHGLTGSQVALSVLGDPVPWPVEIGFDVYSSFEGGLLEATGIMKVPDTQKESSLGGHEVLMVGYDSGADPTIRPANCPPDALIQNSWGTDWGLAGFFWMPLEILDWPTTDLKIVHSGKPW